jgi:hypothetical protein
MANSTRMLPHRPNSSGLRKRLSDFVNARLRRVGYAVVRIDGANRTIHGAWLEPRMPSGGMLVFDDYGFSTCKGITQFVNELRVSGSWIYIYNLNKHALLIKR